MTLLRRLSLLAALLAVWSARTASAPPERAPRANAVPVAEAMQALVRAYPDFLDRVDGNDLVWKDNTRMKIDEGKTGRPLEALLDAPDLKDQFYVTYPLGRAGVPPAVDNDPGRVRHAALFDKMYGDCRKGETKAKLVEVVWLPSHGAQKLLATSVNGVAAKLAEVSKDLEKLSPEMLQYLKPSAGTINCRPIAGTNRISAHGHGIAIDINAAKAEYWRWTKPNADGTYPYKNRIPWEIVEVFERHGFIWGGKWYHYDTMHFEYRPEILATGRAP